jgi:hypothetical protein
MSFPEKLRLVVVAWAVQLACVASASCGNRGGAAVGVASAPSRAEPRIASQLLSREYEAAHPRDQSDLYVGQGPRHVSEAPGFTEIAIERTACYGRCPVDVAVLRDDGRVAYWGESNVPYRGERRGSIYPAEFAYLARLAQDLRIAELGDLYTVAVTDSPTVYVALTRAGRRKIILHHAPADSGPPRLRAFENELERVIAQARWD